MFIIYCLYIQAVNTDVDVTILGHINTDHS